MWPSYIIVLNSNQQALSATTKEQSESQFSAEQIVDYRSDHCHKALPHTYGSTQNSYETTTKMHSRSVKLISWNARGICARTKVAEHQAYISTSLPDIVLLQETFLSQNHSLFCPSYIIIREGRHTHGGGFTIIIRHGIPFSIIQPLKFTAIKHLAIKINESGTSIILSNIYIPHDHHSVNNNIRRFFRIPQHFCASNYRQWSSGHNNNIGRKTPRHSSINRHDHICSDSATELIWDHTAAHTHIKQTNHFDVISEKTKDLIRI